jgi:hypothetical protein
MSGMVKTKPLGVTPPPVKPPLSRSPVGYTPPRDNLAPLPNLIKQQPLPVTNTPQHDQTQAMYAQMLAQLQASQSQLLGLQGQYNQLASQDPTARLNARLMAMYQGDPFAAQRAALNQQYAIPQRLSRAFMGAGY